MDVIGDQFATHTRGFSIAFGKEVHDRRKAKGMTPADIASILGGTEGSVYQYESGSRLPTSPRLLRLCAELDIDPMKIWREVKG